MTGRTNDEVGHVRLLEDVLLGLALFRVTTRRDKDRRMIGQSCHEFPVANGVRFEAGRAVCLRWAMGVNDRNCVNGKGVGYG